MALAVNLTLTFSATKVVLTDVTGAYAAGTNPGGYGTPNPAFADYAHYAIIRKKNVNSVADVVLTLDTFNPLSATVFSSTRAVDGWYEAIKLNIIKWDSATNYTGGTASTGAVVYDDGAVYFAVSTNTNSKPSLNPSIWTNVTTDLTQVESNPNVVATVIGRVTAYNADVYWSKQIAANSQKGQCGICSDSRLKDRLDKIFMHIQAILVADQLGSNQDGEWNSLATQTLGAK